MIFLVVEAYRANRYTIQPVVTAESLILIHICGKKKKWDGGGLRQLVGREAWLTNREPLHPF